jgi:hypothetical protein
MWDECCEVHRFSSQHSLHPSALQAPAAATAEGRPSRSSPLSSAVVGSMHVRTSEIAFAAGTVLGADHDFGTGSSSGGCGVLAPPLGAGTALGRPGRSV